MTCTPGRWKTSERRFKLVAANDITAIHMQKMAWSQLGINYPLQRGALESLCPGSLSDSHNFIYGGETLYDALEALSSKALVASLM